MARKTENPEAMQLPPAATGPTEVSRLIRELEVIDETLLQIDLRSSGAEPKMPRTSRLMDRTVEINKLDLTHKADRAALRDFLSGVKRKSPVLHISLSADPSPDFTEKLVSWLRREIHQSILLTVGLQPNIGAGCIVRTTNKQFDFSLRQDFISKRGLLLEKLAAPAAAPADGTTASKEPA